LPDGLWKWIKKRDHWSKEPSVGEEFDVLLRILGGRSLKEAEPALWQKFKELRDARNKVAHEGKAIIGKKPVDSEKAQSLVEDADTIIKWVEALLPERWRRARTDAQGPFSRRFATPEEAVHLGFATKPLETGASEEELTNADANREEPTARGRLHAQPTDPTA
jgi:hypothetical protein